MIVSDPELAYPERESVAALRALAALPDTPVAVVSLVFLFTRPMRQAVWDLAAKTVVVDR